MVFLVSFNVPRSKFLPVTTMSDLLSYRCLYMVFLVGINVPRSRFHVRLTVLLVFIYGISCRYQCTEEQVLACDDHVRLTVL